MAFSFCQNIYIFESLSLINTVEHITCPEKKTCSYQNFIKEQKIYTSNKIVFGGRKKKSRMSKKTFNSTIFYDFHDLSIHTYTPRTFVQKIFTKIASKNTNITRKRFDLYSIQYKNVLLTQHVMMVRSLQCTQFSQHA